MKETIAAIATPLADGAISIIRMSGEDAICIAQKVFDRNLIDKDANTISYGFIQDPITQEPIDEVLVSLFKAPKSFTCEDIVEINCHGGVYITKRILQLLLANGARLAHPGEFTQRAFLNGRIDLTQAEAVMDLIDAKTKAQAKLAIQGVKGSVSVLLKPLITQILDMIAHIEVNIDYPEYDDVEQLTNDVVLPQGKQWLKTIDEILERAQSGKIVTEGISTVIIGKPNVGKSSLLNALLEEEKAIVTDVEGTTRDIVEGSISLKGITLHLIDTAGIRETQDVVEKIGIAKSKDALDKAQLVLLVFDAMQPMDEQDEALLALTKEKQRLLIYNKKDAIQETKDGIYISAKNGEIQPLLDALYDLYETHLHQIEDPTLANDRQIGKMMEARQSMMQAVEAMELGMELDLVEIDIQNAYRALQEILGEYHRDDLLDTLFSNFCLGK